jgi:leucyl aminopeptidase (aminopeptidase T)
MGSFIGTEQRPEFFSIEAGAAARKMVEQLAQVQAGEEVVITADSGSDARCVELTAREVYGVGATPIVLWYHTRPYPCLDPPRAAARAAIGSDVWIDFTVAYALYSTTFREAVTNGCRYVCLTGMDVDMLVRTIGRVDFGRLQEFAGVLLTLTAGAERVRVTSDAGTDLSARMQTGPVRRFARPPGAAVMLVGQVPWRVDTETINGTLVFDGALWPPMELGALSAPIRLTVVNGRIEHIAGGREASIFERWLASFRHPAMYHIAHFTFGCNPGVTRISGRTLEDERVFGCVEVGIGATLLNAPSHADGIVLNPTVYLDDTTIEQDGVYVHPELHRLACALQAGGYQS